MRWGRPMSSAWRGRSSVRCRPWSAWARYRGSRPMTNLGVEWIEVGSRIVIWPLSRPSYVPAPPELIGPRVYLRPPAFADYRVWASLRDASRDFLVPWEPTWP